MIFELLSALIPQKDAEHLEIDDSLEEVAYPFKQVVKIENTGQLSRDFIEYGEGLGLAGYPGVEAGVFDGGRHTGGHQFEKALVLGGEEAGDFGLDVEDADDFVLDDEGDSEFRADVGIGADVVLGLGDILDEHRFALEGGLAYHPPAYFEAGALDFRRVAYLEAHPELLGAVVEEEDGKDAVVNDGSDEVGDAVHQCVKVESGVESVGEVVEEVDLEGFDSNFWVGGVLVEELGRLGAVVSFEWLVLGWR
jgi:hypothetical protein